MQTVDTFFAKKKQKRSLNLAKYSQNACIAEKSVFRQNILGIEKFI